MNQYAGKTAEPSVATPERAREVDLFYRTIQLVQDAFEFELKGDGIEVHDKRTGNYPAIVTGDGHLEIFAVINEDFPELTQIISPATGSEVIQ